MQSLKDLTDSALLTSTHALVQEERKLTTQILWHLYEIQRRRLYAEQGFGSLFEYATQALGYSEAAAGRRISAMRLLVQVPEAEAPLQRGALSLSTLCTLQHLFQKKPASVEAKRDLLISLQGKSRRECEKILVALAPEAMRPTERERVISPTETEIRFLADDALLAKLKRIRELDAHVNPTPSYAELFHRLADLALKKLDPEKKSAITPPAELDRVKPGHLLEPKPASEPNGSRESARPRYSRFIPAALRREIWRRDQGMCTYHSPTNGRRCASRFALEIDHRRPFALGGENTAENLRLLCRSHNQEQAIQKLGATKMERYLGK